MNKNAHLQNISKGSNYKNEQEEFTEFAWLRENRLLFVFLCNRNVLNYAHQKQIFPQKSTSSPLGVGLEGSHPPVREPNPVNFIWTE